MIRHSPLKVGGTIGLLHSSSALGRMTVGTLMIELSYRKWVTSTDWNICLEGIVINGKWYKSRLTTDKLPTGRPSCDCSSRSTPAWVAPCGWNGLKSQSRFSSQPNSLLSIPTPFAAIRISHVTSPVLQVLCFPDYAWQIQAPRQCMALLPAAMRYRNMMWHDGVCSSPWIKTEAAYAPGKKWNKRMLKENDSVLTLPSCSLSSLASP